MNSRLHTLLQADLGYNASRKADFIKEAKAVLRRVAKSMGLRAGEFKLRVNEGGIAVSGDVKLYTQGVYINVSQGSAGRKDVMYRQSDGLNDSGSGSQNQWMDVETLQSEKGVALLSRMVMKY